MTREDIINLARQHGKPVQEQNAEVEYLFTLEGVNALLAAEREAIIQTMPGGSCVDPQWVCDAIRARGQA
jgi:hypothetical protein